MSPSKSWHSLRQRAEFLYLQQHARKWVTPAFVVHAAFEHPVDVPLVGFTVTKKLGSAVIRNRIKRRLRAVIDQVAAENLLPLCKISLTARHEALTKDFSELVRDAKWALRRMQQGQQDEKKDDQ